ncbi:MAG: hypothetical protein LBS52_00860 [Dysgonamonadaceae bacterium]|nr:hypothetical protein [Dysgonamonadaceae bacterium]
MDKKKKRKIVALMLLATLTMTPTSAFIIHITHGTALSHKLLHIHALCGFLFVIMGILHITYNWKALKSYLT